MNTQLIYQVSIIHKKVILMYADKCQALELYLHLQCKSTKLLFQV